MRRTPNRTELRIVRSVSLPLGVVDGILEAQELMGCSFSESTTRLLRIGLRAYNDTRKLDTEAAP